MSTKVFSSVLFFAVATSAICDISYSEPPATSTPNSPMEPRISAITLGVSDLDASYRFYKEGLGFPTKMTPDGGIVLFATSGTRLMLYPYAKLAEDVGMAVPQIENRKTTFPGFSLGHCVRKKEDVDAILSQAERAGGRILKSARDKSWGGYSGYFADPDGHLWEVLYSDQLKFNPDGSVAVEE
jgi:catechol 2,3-dioxygenase-like lactoylglutathione lyase family enzyme